MCYVCVYVCVVFLLSSVTGQRGTVITIPSHVLVHVSHFSPNSSDVIWEWIYGWRGLMGKNAHICNLNEC